MIPSLVQMRENEGTYTLSSMDKHCGKIVLHQQTPAYLFSSFSDKKDIIYVL